MCPAKTLCFPVYLFVLSVMAGPAGDLSLHLRADEEFPQTLIVSSETADVLSGPGKNHYATDRIPRGTKVDVYRYDPGGFCAIRPPKGSFSLVLASAVKTTADPGVVEVTKSSAKAWVGSRLPGDFKPMWQVRLERGELLNVIRKVEIGSAFGGDPEFWYQVEPPRGEFRWINKSDLGPQTPASVSAAELASRELERSTSDVEIQSLLNEFRTGKPLASSQRNGWKALDEMTDAMTDSTATGYVSPNEAISDFTMAQTLGVQQNLEAIDLALTQMVLQPKTRWNLRALAEQVAIVRKQATTGTELAMATELEQKIIGFRKIQTESRATESFPTDRLTQLRSPDLLSGSNANVASRQTRSTGMPKVVYDGQGILRKLVTKGVPGRPIYALEDENGNILKTISPSTGVNLERFVGKPIGLFGRAGFNNRLNRPHLTAQRVVDLGKIR